MSTPYTGNAIPFPADTVTIPDDSDPPAAITFNVATEAELDGIAWAKAALVPLADLTALSSVVVTSLPTGTVRRVKDFGEYRYDSSISTFNSPLVVAPAIGSGGWVHMLAIDLAAAHFDQTFTAGGSFVVPANVHKLLVGGFGGGGGGASGAGANTASNPPDIVAGGGGGGGAQLGTVILDVTPGETYNVTIGAGGAGGAATADGSDGGQTSAINVALTNGAKFEGGQGGSKAHAIGVGSGETTCSPGGNGTRGGAKCPALFCSVSAVLGFAPGPGGGGSGYAKDMPASTAGMRSLQGWNGGAAGAHGANNTGVGGGGGGGGGGGPANSGGAGGAGGAGATSSAGADGVAGTAAAANSGAGGGAGGGGGNGSATCGNGAAGGAGGSGWLRVKGLV